MHSDTMGKKSLVRLRGPLKHNVDGRYAVCTLDKMIAALTSALIGFSVSVFLIKELAEKLDSERPRSPIDRDTPDELLTEEERVRVPRYLKSLMLW